MGRIGPGQRCCCPLNADPLAGGAISLDLEALGNIGDLIGGVGVVVTLGYLALQIRQNTRSVRDSVYESSARASSDYVMRIGSEADLAELLLSGGEDFSSLSERDRLRVHFILLGILNNYEALYHHYQQGDVDSDLWESRVVRLRAFLQLPGIQTWWSRTGNSFRKSFQQLVDEVVIGGDSP